MSTALNPFRTLQRHRNFRIFWLSQTLSLIGTWMQTMAQGWLALRLTNSAFMVGLVAAAQSLPVLVISIYAGVIVDRTNKLKAVRILQFLLGIQATALWWFNWSGRIDIAWLIALATMNGIINAFEIPARQSMIVELVGREDLPGAIALNSSGFNLARIVGPSVAAVVIASLGISWCFGLNALSFIAVLFGLFMIHLPPWVKPPNLASPAEGMREGLRYMRGTPAIAALIGVVTIFSVLGSPVITLMPVVTQDLLHMGAGGYGALLASVGIGGLFGALWLAAFGHRFRRSQLLAVASFAFALLLVGFAFVRTPWLAFVVLLGVGFTMIVNSAQANAMLQHLVPDVLRGRLMSAYSLIVVGLSQVIGSFVAGAVANAFGVEWAIGGGAVIMFIYGVWAFRRPQLAEL